MVFCVSGSLRWGRSTDKVRIIKEVEVKRCPLEGVAYQHNYLLTGQLCKGLWLSVELMNDA